MPSYALLALILAGSQRVPNLALRSEMTKLLHANVIEVKILENNEVLFRTQDKAKIKVVICAFRDSDRVKGMREPLAPDDSMGEPPRGEVCFKIRRKRGIEKDGFSYVSVEIPNYFGKSVMNVYRHTVTKKSLRFFENAWKDYAVN